MTEDELKLVAKVQGFFCRIFRSKDLHGDLTIGWNVHVWWKRLKVAFYILSGLSILVTLILLAK